MRIIAVLCTFALVAAFCGLIFGGMAEAQGKGGGGGYGKNGGQGNGQNGGQGNGQGGGQNGGQGNGQGGGQNGDQGDWMKEAENRIGWGEDGKEERILPGQTVEDKVKEEWLDKEVEKLGLTEKKVITTFKKLGKRAWNDAESEDKRWAAVRKGVAKNPKELEEETKKHVEKLGKAWSDIDEDMKKKEVLTDAQLETWKEDTKDKRSESATDKSAKQDEIRARKIKELRDRASGNAGDGEKKEKKEKKDEEEK